MPLLECRILKIHSFPHFSLMHFDILSWNFAFHFTVLQIKFECCQFWNLEYWKFTVFRTFLLHALTYNVLSWNFAYDFVLLYCRLSLSVFNLRWFLWELCPFWKSEYLKYTVTVFCTFLLRALTYWAETLHMTLFNVQKIKFECHNSVSV